MSFARKHDIFTPENNMLSSHVKRSPLLWLYIVNHALRAKENIKVKWLGISLVFIRGLPDCLEIYTKLLFSC